MTMRFEGESTTYPFNILMKAALHQVEAAEANRSGAFYPALSSLMMSAFALESTLNHIGSERLSNWAGLERKLSPGKKLARICATLGFAPNMNSDPYSSFDKLFAFRNRWAHAKTFRTCGPFVADPETAHMSDALSPVWVRECTPEEARARFDHAAAIAIDLLQRADLRHHIERAREMEFHSV